MQAQAQKQTREDAPWEHYYKVAESAVDRVLNAFNSTIAGSHLEGRDVVALTQRSYPTYFMTLKDIERQLMDRQSELTLLEYERLADRYVNGWTQTFQKLVKASKAK